MAKCKYPNEVCANMTVLNGNTYCDSVPCSLKDELPKQTNADRIRAMSDEELAKERIDRIDMYTKSDSKEYIGDFEGVANSEKEAIKKELDWLQSEAE